MHCPGTGRRRRNSVRADVNAALILVAASLAMATTPPKDPASSAADTTPSTTARKPARMTRSPRSPASSMSIPLRYRTRIAGPNSRIANRRKDAGTAGKTSAARLILSPRKYAVARNTMKNCVPPPSTYPRISSLRVELGVPPYHAIGGPNGCGACLAYGGCGGQRGQPEGCHRSNHPSGIVWVTSARLCAAT